MKLKKKLYVIFLAGALSFTPSCDLSSEFYRDIPINDFFTTPEQFAALIADAYAQLAGEYGYVFREGFWSLQELTGDAVVVPTRGDHWFDNGVPIMMHTHTWQENTRDVNNGWSFAFGGVGRTNNVLDLIYNLRGDDPAEHDAATRAGIAEAKVLRAFYHLLAMDLYGNIPISDGVREIRQYTRREVFEWIESEILDNINYLTRRVRYGSVTQAVAHTMLTKLYLNAEVYTGTPRWQDAANHADSVISGGFGFILNPDYFTTFSANNTENMEIIFPVVFDAVRAPGNMFHLMTLHYVHQQAFGFGTPTWNGHAALPSFFNKFDDVDKRKAQWFVGPILDRNGNQMTFTLPSLGENPVPAIIVPEVTTLNDPTEANTFEGARFMKFEIEQGIGHHANSDFPIYRFADVLLMRAEALMRLNNNSACDEALGLANQVRRRAGMPDYTAATLTLDELLDERGRELAWEGHRRTDLIRFGRFTTGMWEFMQPRSQNRNIFPIPQWVLDANPGVYTQNNWQ